MCTRFASQIPVTAALLALGSIAAAQIEVGEILGGFDRPLNGAVVLLSDLDGDGVRDLALGSPNADLGFGPNAGLVRFVSGATGQVLGEIHGGGPHDHLGQTLVRVDDLNGDGRDELMVTYYGGGRRVEVWSGGNGPLLFTFTPPLGLPILGSTDLSWGSTLACVGDVDLDGVPDLAIGGPSQISAEIVEIYSGASGTLIATLDGNALPPPVFARAFGTSIAGIGDLNGDGRAEVAVGAPSQWAQCAFAPEGAVAIFNAADWSLLRVHAAGCVGPGGQIEELGSAIAAVGDVNGDGVPDYALEARYPGPGRVMLYSGATGALLKHWNSPGTSSFMQNRGTLVNIGDVDGDGRADLAVTTRDTDFEPLTFGIQNTVQILSTQPPNYPVLDSLRGMRSFGRRLEALGDLDGDGSIDLLVLQPDFLDRQGVSWPGQWWIGRAIVHSLSDLAADAQRDCTSTDNSTSLRARIWFRGSLRISEDSLELLAWNLPPDEFGIFFYGSNAASVPFGNGTRCVGGAIVRLAPVNAGGDGISRLSPSLTQPPPGVPIQPGSPLRFQYWFRDPGAGGAGFDLSDACQLTFVP